MAAAKAAPEGSSGLVACPHWDGSPGPCDPAGQAALHGLRQLDARSADAGLGSARLAFGPLRIISAYDGLGDGWTRADGECFGSYVHVSRHADVSNE